MAPEPRIVSLIPSATEIVAALGFIEQLVGRSHECDFPPEVAGRAVCSEPKIDVHGAGREIDERVKHALRDGMSVYRVFGDVLERLRPTTIITQMQCEICAVSLQDVEAAVCELVGSQPQIVALEPMALDDVWSDIRKVARALCVPDRAERLVTEYRARLAAIEDGTKFLQARPRVACIEWIDPLMSAGNWVPELVEIAGGENLFGQAGQHSPWLDWTSLCEADPDVIVVMPCGWNMERIGLELSSLTERIEWPSLTAVRTGRVALTDGNQYFNRPGPRLVESAEILAEILHPQRFTFGHRGSGWTSLEVR